MTDDKLPKAQGDSMLKQIIGEWQCNTDSKYCRGQDPCFFDKKIDRCPGYGFRIKLKKQEQKP